MKYIRLCTTSSSEINNHNVDISRSRASYHNLPSYPEAPQKADQTTQRSGFKRNTPVARALNNPNIDAIHSQSQPSSFGKGDQTVTDLKYRDGREVRGEDLKWNSRPDDSNSTYYENTFHSLTSDLKNVVETTLFIGRRVEVKLYKLALYDKGGHFDWHRDSTHGENHHATVLVALNTSWEGGSLLLRHNGQEMTVNMHPKVASVTNRKSSESDSSSESGSEREPDILPSITAAAFYTDVEHKVEPVTDGVRLILQYDVFVSLEQDDPDDDFDDYDSNLDNVSGKSRLDFGKKPYDNQVQAPSGFSNEASLSALVAEIQKIIAGGTDEVGIPLRHLYRQASIRKEYLKGVDANIYEKLSHAFTVSLVPVILGEKGSEYGQWLGEGMMVYKASDDGQEVGSNSTEFHLNDISDIVEISNKEYVERVGNHSQEANCKYFGGGMFFRAKSLSA
ncbi:hypothetical protein EV421DRAFT_1981775 [Armillaria borealis]|uniref:Fe2OG dioxygenase domain-containing protein n=1 Tax=Armillaria borealis TaxID=47425 RepID=A0AA39J785_9AGAR|nr:hypothetical protein EV421DRAFT_1981775 [Armillaria borealis]